MRRSEAMGEIKEYARKLDREGMLIRLTHHSES
jgi:hypothetical protein